MGICELERQRFNDMHLHHEYECILWNAFDYTILENIIFKNKAGKRKGSYNDCIIMFDTETSKKPLDEDALYEHAHLVSDEVRDEILNMWQFMRILWDDEYETIASRSEFKQQGIPLYNDGTDALDTYYQVLNSTYPTLFPIEFNTYDMLKNIFNYVKFDFKNTLVDITENHVVAWTISIRAFDMNIVTLYGHRPSELMDAFKKIRQHLMGDDIYVYAHNLAYDWWFTRKFFIQQFSHPEKQLNTKPHYPLYIQFSNGIILKDSLILAQRKLEKWAEDLQVEHQKAVGYWDYDKIRNQSDEFTPDEITYIEHDTLAGVECIDKTLGQLNKSIYSIPYTATGIPRGDIQKAAKENHWKEKFNKMVLEYNEYYTVSEHVFHGGYTHANRHFVERTINEFITKAYDFSSSYPFCLICRKFPMEKFTPEHGLTIEYMVDDQDENAYIFKFCATNIRLKDRLHPMPYLQASKLVNHDNIVTDNGRVLRAEYVEIWLTEIDADIILQLYEWDDCYCCDILQAAKGYLPRWFTDYIYKCYHDNKMYKGVDAVLYAISKAKTNSIYGCTVQKCLKDVISEIYTTGEYKVEGLKEPEEEYEKWKKKRTSILPYQWGLYTTCYAVQNLYKLGGMCDIWIYSDTDSVYGTGWHEDEIEAYTKECISILKERGYEPFKNKDGRTFILGAPESEGAKDEYTEFRVMGAKRYCGRCVKDGKLHITVAGVPKKGAECLCDDIRKFKTGMIFDGLTTGKLQHKYFFVDDIYIDKWGNETGDSIDLSPCDYELSSIDLFDTIWQPIEVQVYEE